MDGREAKSVPRPVPSPYQMPRGFSGYVSGPGPLPAGFHGLPMFRSMTNPSANLQPEAVSNSLRPTFTEESPSQADAVANSHHGMSSSPAPPVEAGKRKRGRPRKYGPQGSMALALSSSSSQALVTQTEKKGRGRPRGSGRKQRLASAGLWMAESAGMAFTPHIITVEAGEDVAAKVLAFSQLRPRVLCVLSGNGVVSSVTLRQPASPGGNISFEGHFEILCLSGSYLVGDSGGPHSRVGGINVSLHSPGSPMIGGSVEILIAATPIQVAACSFIHSSPKARMIKAAAGSKGNEKSPQQQQLIESAPESSAVPLNHHSSPISVPNFWSGSREINLKNPHPDIDLMRG